MQACLRTPACRHGLVGLLTAVLMSTSGLAADDPGARRRPNVLVILADDLGYADVGFQGCRDVPTPHIDALAKHGVRFTNGYVSAPVCSPMRAGFITGRYQQRFGHEFNPGPPGRVAAGYGVPLDQPMLPALMKSNGYATGIVGKWHLGVEEKFHPLLRGFDEFFGFLYGAHSYLDARADPINPIMRGHEIIEEETYLTDAFSREAAAFIERHRERPFFLFLSYNAVHTPMEATPRYLDRFPDVRPPRRRSYAAMLSAMDDGIGVVLDALRTHGLERDTLVVFLSDNGGPPGANASRNDPLREGKGTVYEGGIRVPFVMRWKGRLPEGAVYDYPVISLDILPTALAAAGGRAPEGVSFDGVNLLPYVTGERESRPHETLYWRMGERKAIRHGDRKLVRMREGPWELYDLAADISESNNLAPGHEELVASLAERYAAWEAELAEPRWDLPRRRGRQP